MSSPTSRLIEPQNLPYYSQIQLDQFFDAHERFLKNLPRGRRAVMRFVQAQQMNLSNRKLYEADFTGASFRGARMSFADFERAYLFCADLTSADARQANFRRADLRGVSLRNACLEGAILDEADMREAVLAVSGGGGDIQLAGRSAEQGHGSGAYSVDFSNCSMRKSKLKSAKLKGANFAGALLEGADLEGANLTGANFKGAVLIGAKMERATIDAGALEGCVLDPSEAARAKGRELRARLDDAESWIRSNGRIGSAAKLDDEDLRPLDVALRGRRLTAMSAQRACAVGVTFAETQLQGARFDGADLRDADFSGADLRGASFHGANLHHARFDRADLRDLPLGPSRSAPVDLADAQFSPSILASAIR